MNNRKQEDTIVLSEEGRGQEMTRGRNWKERGGTKERGVMPCDSSTGGT